MLSVVFLHQPVTPYSRAFCLVKYLQRRPRKAMLASLSTYYLEDYYLGI